MRHARRRQLPLACLAALAAQPAAAQPATSIMPADPAALAFQTESGFADAVVVPDAAGATIYLSGVVAGPAAGETDLTPGYERAFERIAATLRRAGVGWADVVDITTFHTDLRGQIQPFGAVKNRYVKAPFPSWTAIGVSALYEPSAVVEIKVIARRRAIPGRRP